MLETIYKTLLIFCWSIMIFMGCYLLFGRVAESLVSSVYTRSRRLIGAGFLIFGVEYMSFSILNLRISSPVIAIGLNLSVLSIVGNMFAAAVFQLLGNTHYVTRKRIRITALQVFLFIGAIWGAIVSGNMVAIRIVLVGGLLLFLCRVHSWIFAFRKVYDELTEMADNTYSESIDVTVEWLPKSMVFIVGLCYVCGVAAFAPMWGLVTYMLFAIFVFYYIFAGLINMMLNGNIVNYLNEFCCRNESVDDCVLPEEHSGATIELRADLVAYIDRRLAMWLDSECYLKSDITMRSLSSDLNTNRTYLSNYINSTYSCSFRDWITKLRVERAKSIMEQDGDTTIADLSSRVGFTSPTSFSRAFTRVEGVTPNRWRELHIKRLIVE